MRKSLLLAILFLSSLQAQIIFVGTSGGSGGGTSSGGTDSVVFCLSTTGPCWINASGTLTAVTDSGGLTDAPVEAASFASPAGTAFLGSGATQASPTVATSTIWFDSTADLLQYKNASNVLKGTMVAPLGSATSHQWLQYVGNDGVQHLARLACADLSDAGALCSGSVAAPYSTQSSAVTTNISAVTMVTAGALHAYAFDWTVSLTTAGTSCSGSTTVTLNAIFTDPNTSSPTTLPLGTLTLAASGNGTAGFVASGRDHILAKSGTAVQYSTSGYTLGTGCSPGPTYQVSPALTQLW